MGISNMMSEVAPKKNITTNLFFMWTWYNVKQGKLDFYLIFGFFCPNRNFYTQKITNSAGKTVINKLTILPRLNQFI